MAWRRPGDKPLSEAMRVSSLTHKCVTRPQWVNRVPLCRYGKLFDKHPHNLSKSHRWYKSSDGSALGLVTSLMIMFWSRTLCIYINLISYLHILYVNQSMELRHWHIWHTCLTIFRYFTAKFANAGGNLKSKIINTSKRMELYLTQQAAINIPFV